MKDAAVVSQLGKELRRMRLERNLSQAEVAERAGLDRTTVVKLEAGRAATLQTLVQVLRAMDRLELLDAFHQEPQPTPYMLVEAQTQYLKKQRKRAGRKRPDVRPPKPNGRQWHCHGAVTTARQGIRAGRRCLWQASPLDAFRIQDD